MDALIQFSTSAHTVLVCEDVLHITVSKHCKAMLHNPPFQPTQKVPFTPWNLPAARGNCRYSALFCPVESHHQQFIACIMDVLIGDGSNTRPIICATVVKN